MNEGNSIEEIKRYAKWTLEKAAIGNRLPTPVNDIVACAKLAVAEDVSLREVSEGFFTKALGILKAGLSKLRAIVDLRDDRIYLDLSLPPQKINWAKLHECGHSVLPWQRDAYYLDDDYSLAPEVKDQFEREANFFAAEVMFQLGRFAKDAADLPLSIKSPLKLSKLYGASCHAAIRRYVETHKSACAVLVCKLSKDAGELLIEQQFCSPGFSSKHGTVRLPRVLDERHQWSKLVAEKGIRLMDSGSELLVDSNGLTFLANFHIFNNTYNVFVFVFPHHSTLRGWRRIVAA